ncbi:MAG TPA: guanylate kinase [Steroidobacteraceae bacterium]|jgi:guanylate kinase|nr:guanylate kinase [Steroidobacteraceae bacterium]
MSAKRRGSLFVIAAPSGAGKTSLVKAVLERDPSLRVSISHTTRKQRPSEVPGEHYHFIGVDEFQRLRDAGEFLEHAQVFDNFYGTGRAQVEALRNAGHDVILEIDWQGARQVRAAQPDCKSVFILPPSRRELEVRLRNRRTDSEEVIARRLRDSIADMSHYAEFDSVIVNQDFERAVQELLEVLRGSTDYGSGRESLKPLLAELLG